MNNKELWEKNRSKIKDFLEYREMRRLELISSEDRESVDVIEKDSDFVDARVLFEMIADETY